MHCRALNVFLVGWLVQLFAQCGKASCYRVPPLGAAEMQHIAKTTSALPELH
jgi:hypothetical protein